MDADEQPQKKPHEGHDWHLDPATEKQINYLASFGITAKAGLTKGDASDLIERAQTDPNALDYQREFRAREFERGMQQRAAFPSYYLKRDISAASGELQSTKAEKHRLQAEITAKRKQLAKAEEKVQELHDEKKKADAQSQFEEIKSELEEAQAEQANSADELTDAQNDLRRAKSRRLNFWKATFKQHWILLDGSEELSEFGDTIDKLYAAYGCHFKVPTSTQISQILETLDKTSDDWDMKQPKLFYTQLKVTVPDCTQTSRRPAKTAHQGCLVLILGILFIYLLAHLRLFL
jgi:DNA repair exonuclease SbcCD ATPase subunit